MGAKRIEEVVAWQLADAFKKEAYRLLQAYPAAAHDLPFRDQLRSAAASVGMNIAEGFYRFNGRDFARYLTIALSSLGEAMLWIRDGVDRGYFPSQACTTAFSLGDRCRMATLKFRSRLLDSLGTDGNQRS